MDEATAGGSTGSARPRILIVDDDQGVRSMIRNGLKRDFELDEAVNGLKALECIHASSYDLILLDVMMPEMDGLEVLQHLGDEGRMEQLKVIVITAKSDDHTVTAALALGAVDVIVKPFRPRELRQEIFERLGMAEQSESA